MASFGWALASLSLVLAACSGTDGPGVEEQVIDTKEEVSGWIDRMAEKIDLYLASKKYVDKPNKSSITLHNGFSLTEDGKRIYSPRVGVKLHLPNLQEKLQLRFTSYDEDQDERGINENRFLETPAEKSYSTSLALFQDLGNVRTEFRPRLDFNDKVKTAYLIKFSSEAKRGAFTIDPELQLFARSDTGTGQFIGINFDFELTAVDTLTLVNEEQYTDSDNTLSTNHGWKWSHQYNETMSHVTALIFESNNRARYHLEKTVFTSSFRHKLRENTLHYAVTPNLTFQRTGYFRPHLGLDLGLDFIF